MKKKIIKTPLRYPGGKSRALKRLNNFLPSIIEEFREPFVGGGSVALHITQNNPQAKVWVNDLYEPLYSFWICLRDNPTELVNELIRIKRTLGNSEEDHKQFFISAKEELPEQKDRFRQAVLFFVLNKCSFSGLTEAGSFSSSCALKLNFNENNINKLLNVSPIIKNWEITNLDYTNLLTAEGNKVFIYLDPPYKIGTNLYGRKGSLHKNFDHSAFYDNVSTCNHNWLVSYNSTEEIRNKWNLFQQHEFELSYFMVSTGTYREKQKKKNELVIKNYSLQEE